MNVIFRGKRYKGKRMRIKEGHLFVDDQDLGECNNPNFRSSTIDGEVFITQWGIVDGGENG